MDEKATDVVEVEENFLQEFNNDSRLIGEQVTEFLRLTYPSYLVDSNNIEPLIDDNSTLLLESMSFFRISSCTADNVDKVFENVNENFEKLYTALYSIDVPVTYGLISRDGVTNLVIGVYKNNDVQTVKTITQGMLSGIELEDYKPTFKRNGEQSYNGILSGIPSLYVDGDKQKFSLSSIMRSLNGQNYTLLFIAKPVKKDIISQNITDLISVKDKAFAVSKRNIARNNSYSESNSHSTNINDSKQNTAGSIGGGAGAAVGAFIGTIIAPVAGTALGGAVGGGLGTVIGSIVGQGKSHSEGYSDSISKTISNGETVSGDIQNGFAIELMNYADSAIERLKAGQNNGIWQTAIVYSAEKEISRNVIRACLSGELSKLDSEKLPMIAFEPKATSDDTIKIPVFLEGENYNSLCSYINSAELGLLCTVPTESVPDFELRLEKKFPLIASHSEDATINVGKVIDGKHALDNMPFALSERDLNKHTFVCGITGSGKTTTVKKILVEANKPFLVIESAKKEYRNIAVDTEVYTLGKPEINAPQVNPFYIMPGVSPQVHIDYLKDLFNASFSFYGPMTYILEKCLHAVYKNKGWNLTMGYHPMFVNSKSPADFFNIEYTKERYSYEAHKFLFPTMQELKDEIARYIDEELKYDGEVAGNVKTAMKVRLENLCVGAKGYTFNTNEIIDFEELLENKKAVFELEGLADDSDKAFSVGLLVIFINEYRQVRKEISGSKDDGLKHLLVIEEAHRLLKNVDTERTSESTGNPKGKAVEHFTNMLAEMRSYGQGVIVAEQIPTKLAPDVIKNSSTKIVQRIVSVDDQRAIANTIGISEEDAIQLGSLETGLAYCHKEGMVLPVPVKISNYIMNDDGTTADIDVFVSDEELYNGRYDRFERINMSVIRNSLSESKNYKQNILRFINTLMIEETEEIIKSCISLIRDIKHELKRKDVQLIFANEIDRLIAKLLTESIVAMITRGVYQSQSIPENDFIENMESMLYAPNVDNIGEIRVFLKKMYGNEFGKFAKQNIATLIKINLKPETNWDLTIKEYLMECSEKTIVEISNIMKGEWRI